MTKTKISKAKAIAIAKKIAVVVITIAILAGVYVGGFFTGDKVKENQFDTYSMIATVSEVNPDTSDVYFETTSGHIFYIVTDEVFAINETYTITFNTNGTATVEDDEIFLVSRDISMY